VFERCGKDGMVNGCPLPARNGRSSLKRFEILEAVQCDIERLFIIIMFWQRLEDAGIAAQETG
jgi:hypothetical protein